MGKQPRPLIGITCGIHHDQGIPFYGLLGAYTKSVALAGGLPVMITPNQDEDILREIFFRVDGVLLAGGGDIDPARYGMNADDLVHNVDPNRDATEIALAQWSAQEDKPIFGICRGCQVANVALGGTLYRDIQTEYPGYNGIAHDLWGKQPRDYMAHAVQIKPATRLEKLIGERTAQVNSLHHQALRDVAPGLKVTARAADGLVEGIELPEARFFLAVQWHPEELAEHSAAMRHLFEGLIEAARTSP